MKERTKHRQNRRNTNNDAYKPASAGAVDERHALADDRKGAKNLPMEFTNRANYISNTNIAMVDKTAQTEIATVK